MEFKKINKIDLMVDDFIKNNTNEKFAELIEELINTNVILINKELGDNNLKKLNDDAITPLVITDSLKQNYIPIFSGDHQIINDELKKMKKVNYVFKDLCNDSIVNNDYIEGYVLNPFTQGLKLPKEVIKIVIKYVNEEQNEKAVS